MPSNRALSWMLLCIATTSGTGVVGCGKVAEKIREKAIEKVVEKSIESQSGGKVRVDLNGQQASVVSNNGKTRAAWGQGATVPDDFPKQVPLYPGAKVVSSVADKTNRPRHVVVLQTSDASVKVLGYYKGELSSFSVEQEVNTGGTHALKFVDKKAKLTVDILASDATEPSPTNVVVQTESTP